jgi:hypothetical protein
MTDRQGKAAGPFETAEEFLDLHKESAKLSARNKRAGK